MPSESITWLLDAPVPTLPSVPLTIPARENYTGTEITAAVEKLVQDAIRRPYGILGERKTGDAFDDTLNAAAGVFILTPAAPFYVLLLGSRRLSELIASAITSALDLLDAIESTGRRAQPLTSITSLGNARTALSALESASAARMTTFEDISQTPAFQRFDTHTDRFLADAAGAIKVGSEIVQTPQQARTQLGNLVSVLTSAMAEVERKATLIEKGIEDFNSLNLPALLTQGVITKAREVLQDRIDQLTDLSPTERLEFLRDTVLDVLTSKAVVKGFGSLARSGTFVPITGIGTTFTDADHLGEHALVSSDYLDPFTIVTGADELTFIVDGGPTTFTIPLTKSFIARLEGTAVENFVIDGTNDKFRLDGEHFNSLTVTLTHGTRSAAQIASDINLVVGVRPIIAEPYFLPEKFTGSVSTSNISGLNLDFFFSAGNWGPDFGVEVGDLLLVLDGSMAGSVYTVTFFSAHQLTGTLVSGTQAVEASVSVSVGPAARAVRVRFTDAGAPAALDASDTLTVLSVTNSAAATLGFVEGMVLRCRRTRADEIAAAINSSATASVANVPRISATSVYSGGAITRARGEPSDPTKVVSSLYRAFGDVIVAGSNPTFAVAGAASAGVVPGDIVTIRATSGSGTGRTYVVLTVDDAEVTSDGVLTASLATGVDLEFGKDLNAARDQVLRIEAPSPLAGDYRVTVGFSNPTELQLDRPLPLSFLVGGQGYSFQMSTGALRLDIQSESTTTSSELSVSGTAASKFYFSPPAIAIGSTPYVLLPSDPRVLSVGDRFEIYTGQYNEPELTFGVAGFERGQQLLTLDANVPNSFITLDFSTEVTVPFARIRKVERNNYDAYKVQLGLWLALDVNQTQYFRDLNRFINPLLVNDNPTASAVGTAKTHLQTLIQALQQLQVIIAAYEVDVVPRVDTLVDSFLSRGADRAVDTLLEGRFRDFFGYNSEEVSYLGNALERLRDVSRLDLPIRRKSRKEVIDQELTLGQFEEPNFEYDQSDTQDVDEPDFPGSVVDVSGSSF
jgi:hypothetical protein